MSCSQCVLSLTATTWEPPVRVPLFPTPLHWRVVRGDGAFDTLYLSIFHCLYLITHVYIYIYIRLVHKYVCMQHVCVYVYLKALVRKTRKTSHMSHIIHHSWMCNSSGPLSHAPHLNAWPQQKLPNKYSGPPRTNCATRSNVHRY